MLQRTSRRVFWLFTENLGLRTRAGLHNALEARIENELGAFREQRVPHDIGVFVSPDIVQPHSRPARWVEEEERLLNEHASRWAADNGVILGRMKVRVFLLETLPDQIHVGPIAPPAPGKGYEAVFEIVTPGAPGSTAAGGRFAVRTETVIARFASEGVEAIEDPYISRDRHAILRVEAGRVHVTACPSRNGTWINGTRLADDEERVVFVGDELKLGRTVLRLERVAQAE